MTLDDYRELLVGLPISHIWRGYGSAIFVEIGKLESKPIMDTDKVSIKGEHTLMIEWSWRIEKPKSILGGSFSNPDRWENMFQKLIGETITNIRTISSIPEIEFTLSNNYRIVSFATESGQPEWAILSRNKNIGTLHVKRGKVVYEIEN